MLQAAGVTLAGPPVVVPFAVSAACACWHGLQPRRCQCPMGCQQGSDLQPKRALWPLTRDGCCCWLQDGRDLPLPPPAAPAPAPDPQPAAVAVPTESSDSSGAPVGVIVGCTVAGVAVLAAAAGFVYWRAKRHAGCSAAPGSIDEGGKDGDLSSAAAGSQDGVRRRAAEAALALWGMPGCLLCLWGLPSHS